MHMSFCIIFSVAPLAGHLKVNIHDAAWATIHVGILGFDLTIFKAEICFKGGIEYHLNMLAVCLV